MRYTITQHKKEEGYSLIEMALMLILIGVIAVPAFYIYGLYMQNQKIERTEFSLSVATNAIGGYRSIHGRYPCPAAANVPRGNINYGYEDCTPAPPGIVSSLNSLGQTVLTGTLPFRELGLTEDDAHDGFNNRLTYAVTETLTNEATFNMTGGGIGIVDFTDPGDLVTTDSLITPAESAHFVVLSHNSESEGAWTRAGVQVAPCSMASLLEQENCDGDATFRKASKRADFDDRVFYTTSIGLTHWQLATADENNIHLIKANNFAVGLDNGLPPPTNAGTVEVINYATETDQANIAVVAGAAFSSEICREYGTDCFSPTAIYGLHSDGEGMACSSNEFLVGIENGGKVCRNEVKFECPAGQFLSGIDPGTGAMVCNTVPLLPCSNSNLTTTCGDSRAVSGTFSGGYSYAYSGECYRAALSDADIGSDVSYILSSGAGSITSHAGTTIYQGGGITEVQTYIDDVNAMARVAEDCGATAPTAQVRDSFLCYNGSWGPHSPYDASYASEMAHERLRFVDVFSGSPTVTMAPHPAEVTASYAAGVDVSNINDDHDCWCREDFRVEAPACSAGMAGNEVRIMKHRCPQTSHIWTQIFSSVNLCTCTQGPEGPFYYNTCYNYFGVSTAGTTTSQWSRVSGYVYRDRYRKCDAGGNIYYDPDWQYDVSQCQCHEVPEYSTTACPFGTSNSFTYNLTNYTNTAEIKKRQWNCPTGNNGPVTTTSEAGTWNPITPITVHTEPCVCDASVYEDRYSDCALTLHGSPNAIHERRYWDCTINAPTGGWGPWQMISNACYACVWTPPAGGGNIQTTAGLHNLADTCACNDAPGSCYQAAGGGNYEVWTGCQCSP